MPAVMTGYAATGLPNPKFVRRRLSDGAWWSTAGTPAFEAFNAVNIAAYGIAAIEAGATGVYTASDPSPDTPGDCVLIAAAGASLAQADVAANRVGDPTTVGVTDASVVSIAANAITAASLAADAVAEIKAAITDTTLSGEAINALAEDYFTNGYVPANAVRIGGSQPAAGNVASFYGGGAMTTNSFAFFNGTGYAGGAIKLRVVDSSGNDVAPAASALTAAQVNAEVLDVLSVDTFAEPTGVPAAAATLADKIGRGYQALRNAVTVTASSKTFYSDAGAALWSKVLSDDGTTFSEAEGA